MVGKLRAEIQLRRLSANQIGFSSFGGLLGFSGVHVVVQPAPSTKRIRVTKLFLLYYIIAKY
jgi:hypothetical protein